MHIFGHLPGYRRQVCWVCAQKVDFEDQQFVLRVVLTTYQSRLEKHEEWLERRRGICFLESLRSRIARSLWHLEPHRAESDAIHAEDVVINLVAKFCR
jgi:hypothetical protein